MNEFGMVVVGFIISFFPASLGIGYAFYSLYTYLFEGSSHEKLGKKAQQQKAEQQKIWFYNLWFPSMISLFGIVTGTLWLFWIFYPIYHILYFLTTKLISCKYYGGKFSWKVFWISVILFLVASGMMLPFLAIQ